LYMLGPANPTSTPSRNTFLDVGVSEEVVFTGSAEPTKPLFVFIRHAEHPRIDGSGHQLNDQPNRKNRHQMFIYLKLLNNDLLVSELVVCRE
jgi:hypothetical protein